MTPVPDPLIVERERKMTVRIRKLEAENKALQERIAELERQLMEDDADAPVQPAKPMPQRGPGGKFLKKQP